MSQRRTIVAFLCLIAGIATPAASATSSQGTRAVHPASHGPMKLLTVRATFAKHQADYRAAKQANEGVVPPPAPCPQNGLMPEPQVDGIYPVPNCGVPELPLGAGTPYPGTMSYYGGHIQAHPHEYLVLWGWGLPGAFGKRDCKAETFTVATSAGTAKTRLGCDPDGAGKYMADFVSGIGGTEWAKVQDQYYETSSTGKTFIDESGQLLAGVWADDGPYPAGVNPNLTHTKGTNPGGHTNTYSQLALEASRAAAHFGISGNRGALDNANFIIAQPQVFADPQAASTSSLIGYCAFHDYTLPAATGNKYYAFKGIVPAISYTNMPYSLNAGGGCGENAVNKNGKLDEFSIGLGHEIEETATDPGSEDVVHNILTGGSQYFGGWYDSFDGEENGDKCAYVGESPTSGLVGPSILPMPGAMGDITTRTGTYAVQALWSDASLGGTGWCAGIPSTDLPGSLAGAPPYR